MLVTMSNKELHRLPVIQAVVEKRLRRRDAASVAVYHRFFIFSERIECVVEHAIHPFGVWTCSYRPAHHFAIKTVDYGRQLDLARRQVELRNISQPLLIWVAGSKIAGKQTFRCRPYFSAVRTVSSLPGSLNDELLLSHQPAGNLFRDAELVLSEHRVQTPVAIAAVISLKDLYHGYAYFRVLITQTPARFVIKIATPGKLQNTEQFSDGIDFLQGINDLGILPVLLGQDAGAHVFLYQFIRFCQDIAFKLQLMNLLFKPRDFIKQCILVFILS